MHVSLSVGWDGELRNGGMTGATCLLKCRPSLSVSLRIVSCRVRGTIVAELLRDE
jgi:hypothetical protein